MFFLLRINFVEFFNGDDDGGVFDWGKMRGSLCGVRSLGLRLCVRFFMFCIYFCILVYGRFCEEL